MHDFVAAAEAEEGFEIFGAVAGEGLGVGVGVGGEAAGDAGSGEG